MDVLKYDKELESMIDNYQVIPSGSLQELEIRASTVIAVDMLHQILLSKGFKLYAIELDWLLWQKGEDAKEKIKPHHRTFTIFY